MKKEDLLPSLETGELADVLEEKRPLVLRILLASGPFQQDLRSFSVRLSGRLDLLQIGLGLGSA